MQTAFASLSAANTQAVSAQPVRVALCGPIAPVGEPAGGGYEAANRRTCDALRRHGLTVLEWPYPRTRGGVLAKALAYATAFARLMLVLAWRRGDYDVLHLTPLNMGFARVEHLLLRWARATGRPVLMDVRAGTFVRHYQASSARYRHVIDASLRCAERVAVEGEGYLAFVGDRHTGAALYLPNFVEDAVLQQPLQQELPGVGGQVRLAVVGRLVPAKGVSTALDVARLLSQQGWRVHIDLVGEGDTAQIDAWQAAYNDVDAQWHGPLAPGALLAVLGRAHFFVFPSRHNGEGHSNALNEAMARGVVPVCSDQGFSASVVGEAGRVLPIDAAPADYAASITTILAEGSWTALSAAARERVQLRYSEAAILPALLATYRGMV